MKPRTAQSLALWLLPWLAARLMIPAGFMPVTGDAHLRWVLCSVTAPPAERAPPAAPGDGAAGLHKTLLCPFAAAAASAAPPPAAAVFASAVPSRAFVPPDRPAPPVSSGAPRSQQARGPPALS